jgi:DNA mismatch repair protein MutS
MGGKSTYLRQVALTSIMAQVGSHVPARTALLPIVDRVFTRIGAGDNLAQGKSTFLVEMEETASICTQATENSLVILDEVGRGTSTYDGLALAQAVVEYIHTVLKARCLFATHYQELTLLEQRFAGIANYHAASTKSKTGILFLYKILPGIAQGSFGIEVAKIAQLPKEIIKRAEVLLHELDGKPTKVNAHVNAAPGDNSEALADAHEKIQILEQQLQQQKNALQHIAQIDYDNLSPRQAFDLVWKFKEFQQ